MIQYAGFTDSEVVQARRVGGALGFGPAPTGPRGPGGRPLPAGYRCDGDQNDPTWPSPPERRRGLPVTPAGADAPQFSIAASYNPHLLPGATRLEVLLTLTAARLDTPAAATGWEVRLRLQTPRGCRITAVLQQSPERLDLFGLGVPGGDGFALEVPVGAWAGESRDYFVVAELPPREAGEEATAFRPQVLLVHDGAQFERDGGWVTAHWTDDLALAAQDHHRVADWKSQQELVESIRAGLAARCRGDLTMATLLLGRAVQISADAGNTAMIARLARVVEVLDAGEGTVRLRPAVDQGALLELGMGRLSTLRCR